MLKLQIFNRGLSRLSLGLLVISGLGIGMGPGQPAMANTYETCAKTVVKAGVDREVAGIACAQDLHPVDLGRCVERVTQATLGADAALSACRRVRRPLELAECVTDIHFQDKQAPMPDVLESCRKSLLPTRFGECVTGLSRDPLKLSTREGLDVCLNASDRPRDLQLVPLDSVLGPSQATPSITVPTPISPAPVIMPTPTPSPTTNVIPQRF
ncbi:hypothetical protein ACN4EG_09110 [Alkalinema pantanalense CENA528]|uniref:hypothetical protein n=1 Tax=Alkalinema pantanalense TaxID=1620705 RepID=UPI003D6FC429